jgi:hypothetical protein
MICTFLLGMLTTNSLIAGSVSTYHFLLDTSVQKNQVFIDQPTFPSDAGGFNFNNLIKCNSSTTRFPIVINQMDTESFACTQNNPIDLKQGQMNILPLSALVHYQNKTIIFMDDNYYYNPWNNAQDYSYTYLIYLDNNGNLAYREV